MKKGIAVGLIVSLGEIGAVAQPGEPVADLANSLEAAFIRGGIGFSFP